jgi:hypothetical protein
MTQIINGNGPQIFTAGSSLVSAPVQTANGLELATMSNVKAQAQSQLVLGTAVLTTSGTVVDFTGIPAGVKRITVVLNGVSSNGVSPFQVQIGSGANDATGYQSTAIGGTTGNSLSGTTSTTGFLAVGVTGASSNVVGLLTIANVSGNGNTWVMSGTAGIAGGSANGYALHGLKALVGTLDRLRLTTVNGTDTFDAGSVNILMEF